MTVQFGLTADFAKFLWVETEQISTKAGTGVREGKSRQVS